MTTIRRRTGLHDSDGRLIGGVVDDAVSVLDGDSRRLELSRARGRDRRRDDTRAARRPRRAASSGRRRCPRPDGEIPSRAGARRRLSSPRWRCRTWEPMRARATSCAARSRSRPSDSSATTPSCASIPTPRECTRRASPPAGSVPICARFRPLVDEAWSSALRDELGWLADHLGDVRDGDVLLERLRHRVAELPDADERDAAAAMLAALELERNAAHSTLLEALRSGRYLRLLDDLVAAANAPSLRESASEPGERLRPRARAPSLAQAGEARRQARGQPVGRGTARGTHPDEARPVRRRSGRADRRESRRGRSPRPPSGYRTYSVS